MKRYRNNSVLAFGDTHFPYVTKGWYEFLENVKDAYSPDRVIHLGDILDVYSVSSYPTDIDHPDSWSDEIRKARKDVAKLAYLFPEMEVMESNHDDRAYRKSRTSGIPREFLIPYKDVIGAPEGWRWYKELTITVDSTREQLFFAHTKTGGATACAIDKGVTSVLGHQHSKFGMVGVKPNKYVVYGVDAGCLCSDKGSPFKYNKADRFRPIRGCTVITNGIPVMIPFM